MILALAFAAACLPVHSDRITAGDLAAVVPAFRALPAWQVLSYAPLPGHSRVFPASELRQRVPSQAELPESVCFEWPMRSVSLEDAKKAMLAELPSGSTVNVTEIIPAVVAPGAMVFPAARLRNGVWTGFVEWAPGRRTELRARVEVSAPFSRVMATEAIRPGQRMESTLLRLEAGTGEPQAGLAASMDQVVGRIARRLIRAGTAVPLASLADGVTVARGDPVHVRVVAGNMSLGFDGVAEGRGAIGEVVPVRNPRTKRLVHARVEARGIAVTELASSARR